MTYFHHRRVLVLIYMQKKTSKKSRQFYTIIIKWLSKCSRSVRKEKVCRWQFTVLVNDIGFEN